MTRLGAHVLARRRTRLNIDSPNRQSGRLGTSSMLTPGMTKAEAPHGPTTARRTLAARAWAIRKFRRSMPPTKGGKLRVSSSTGLAPTSDVLTASVTGLFAARGKISETRDLFAHQSDEEDYDTRTEEKRAHVGESPHHYEGVSVITDTRQEEA